MIVGQLIQSCKRSIKGLRGYGLGACALGRFIMFVWMDRIESHKQCKEASKVNHLESRKAEQYGDEENCKGRSCSKGKDQKIKSAFDEACD